MDRIENKEVADVFRHYPQGLGEKLLLIRQLILDTALETDGVGRLEETLKWGEPSYVSEFGGYDQDRLETKKSTSVCDVLSL